MKKNNINFETYCDPDTSLEVFDYSRLSDKSLSYEIIENACILPPLSQGLEGEIISSNLEVVPNVNPNVNYPIIDYNLSIFDFKNIDIENEPVIYLGSIINCWGHFFTDGFSRLWFFFSNYWPKLKHDYPKIKILFVTPYIDRDYVPQPYLDLLALLDLDIIIEPILKLRRYKKIYLPSMSWFVSQQHRCYTNEFSNLIDQLLSNCKICTNNKYEKIYLSRKHWIDKNADFGEKAIEKLFNKVGYLSISPEKFSVAEQISMFNSAKSIVSTSGSLAHNAMFCNSNAELIILRKSVGSEDYQMAINKLKSIKVTYIDCHLSLFVTQDVNLGPFFIYINQNLVRFFYDRFGVHTNNNFSSSKYMSYVKMCLKRPDFYYRNPMYNKMSKYYPELLYREMNEDKNIYRKIYDFLNKYRLNNSLKILKKIYCKLTR